MRRLVLRSESIHLSGIDALHRVWAIPIVVLLAEYNAAQRYECVQRGMDAPDTLPPRLLPG